MRTRRAFRTLALTAALLSFATSGWAQKWTAAARIGDLSLSASHAQPGRHAKSVGYSRYTRSSGVSTSTYRGPRYRGEKSYRSYHFPRRVWVPGHYEHVSRKVFVPARSERVWIDPLYETRIRSCGTRVRVLVRAGYWKEVCQPAHYVTRSEKVWIPGRFEWKGR